MRARAWIYCVHKTKTDETLTGRRAVAILRAVKLHPVGQLSVFIHSEVSMGVSTIHKWLIVGMGLAMSASLQASDYSYKETTQITGGSIMSLMKMAGTFSSQARKAGEPIVSNVYLKGNRLARVSPDHAEIIDLDKETVTNIDTVKRTYTVLTFEQMRLQMQKAMQQSKQQQQQQQQQPDTAQQYPDVKMSYDVKVRNTGAQKQVSGLNASEAILTMSMTATDQKKQQSGSMAVTNDMWMVPEVPGYEQVRDFQIRMAQKMGLLTAGVGLDMSRLLAQNPGANEALADMGKEMQKLKGVPVMQVMRMGSTANGAPLPAASEAPLPPDNTPAMPSGSDIAKQSAASALTSKLGGLGGFGGFGHKKKDASAENQNANQNANQNGQAAQATAAVLMEMQVTSSDFSSAPVDDSHFAVPAGFKLIEPQMH